MRNIKLTIEYDGTNYFGWQVQNRDKDSGLRIKTIQATIEKVLQRVLRERVKLIGSGRTDSGVHAKGQVANFKTNSDMELKKIQLALNGLLPRDIAIIKIEQVALDFHSRYDAKSKLYQYLILSRKYPSAMLRNTAYFYPDSLNIRLMREQARLLIGKHNFKSFQASDKRERGPIRTIKSIKITKTNDLIKIDIEADGFLRNMARNIVGTLIEIGKGKPIDIKELLKLKDRSKAGSNAPAKGLHLINVNY